MKKTPPTTLLAFTAGVAVVALLTSCETTDPAFEAVRYSIPDTDYPATQIAGRWLNVQANHARTWEIKSYIELRPDGTGLKRMVASDNGTKSAEKMEALRWSYLGKNRWSVAVVPGSVQHLYGEEWWNEYAADTSVFRFLPPRLYDFTFEISYVPLDDRGLVRTIHQEQRGQQ